MTNKPLFLYVCKMNTQALILFVRNPQLGKVKTRLAKTIGNQKALQVYQYLLQHTHQITQNLHQVDKFLYYADALNHEDLWQNDRYHKAMQDQTPDLGQRMQHAFGQCFNKKYEKVMIIGSDCAQLTQKIIEEAYQHLDQNDVALGKALDGGYYLLGMKKLHKDLFINKQWSTETVAQDTIADCQKNNLSIAFLPTLSDIDQEEDLKTIPNFQL